MVAAKHQSLRLLSLSTSHWTISESFFRPFLSGYFSRTKQVDTVPSARHMNPMIRYVHGAPNFCNSAFIMNGITRPPIPLPLAERPNASPRRLSNHWGTIPIIVYNIASKSIHVHGILYDRLQTYNVHGRSTQTEHDTLSQVQMPHLSRGKKAIKLCRDYISQGMRLCTVKIPNHVCASRLPEYWNQPKSIQDTSIHNLHQSQL